ncbi:MAG: hypothetical protein NC388_08415 [Clostridium sp.]|nr:hypothetical protein [Clostridium sp.]
MEKENKYLMTALAVALLTACATAVLSMRGGHVMNGDYALYVCQALKLPAGGQWQLYRDMQQMLALSTYRNYSPVLYPWGLPLMLALPAQVWGIHYTVFKLLVFACLPAALLLIYKDARTRGDAAAGAWVMVLTALSTAVGLAAELVITTLPYLFMLTLTLTLTYQLTQPGTPTGRTTPNTAGTTGLRSRRMTAALLGAALFLTVQIRTEGILLLPAMGIHLAANRRHLAPPQAPARERWLTALTPYGVCLALALLTLPQLPVGYLVHAGHTRTVDFSVTDTAAYYLSAVPRCCLSFLRPAGETGLMIGPERAAQTAWWMVALFWTPVAAGLLTAPRQTTAGKVYVALHLLMLAAWPYQTERYAVPLVPAVLYFGVKGVQALMPARMPRRALASGGVLLFVSCCQLMAWGMRMGSLRKDYDAQNLNVEGESAQEVLRYLNTRTRPQDIIACGESRTIYLYTGRLSCNLSLSATDTAAKADWYVVFKHRHNYLQHRPEELAAQPHVFRPVLDNKDFTVYKITKP